MYCIQILYVSKEEYIQNILLIHNLRAVQICNTYLLNERVTTLWYLKMHSRLGIYIYLMPSGTLSQWCVYWSWSSSSSSLWLARLYFVCALSLPTYMFMYIIFLPQQLPIFIHKVAIHFNLLPNLNYIYMKCNNNN